MLTLISCFAKRMAIKTSLACIYIVCYFAVFILQISLIVVFMAINTAEYGIISGIGMAFCTLVPGPGMPSTIDREVLSVVIKCRRLPGILRMTTFTIGRELGRTVIRVCGIIIIHHVSSRTGVRCIGIIPVMTGGTIIGNGSMGPVQCIILIVVVECGRIPFRFFCMTRCTIHG